MKDIRCECNKIICQLEGNEVIIKCRHCKRNVVIKVKGINEVSEKSKKIKEKIAI
ncbi:hypothetical protein MFMK1_002268 [Metallumcola ferriviriculae]|uniref:Uncharacterized protein n=1 Tax=Metallumcola ferriviriculae TaxID=3039180 RepID=A0AAU0UQE0_9FIRM|nr:hypothetical protein MFMK1_002268 [Desulfitibacteraceae bacterium MK1]